MDKYRAIIQKCISEEMDRIGAKLADLCLFEGHHLLQDVSHFYTLRAHASFHRRGVIISKTKWIVPPFFD